MAIIDFFSNKKYILMFISYFSFSSISNATGNKFPLKTLKYSRHLVPMGFNQIGGFQ